MCFFQDLNPLKACDENTDYQNQCFAPRVSGLRVLFTCSNPFNKWYNFKFKQHTLQHSSRGRVTPPRAAFPLLLYVETTKQSVSKSVRDMSCEYKDKLLQVIVFKSFKCPIRTSWLQSNVTEIIPH